MAKKDKSKGLEILRSVSQIVHEITPGEFTPEEISLLATKEIKPKILIVGLMSDQTRAVQKVFGNAYVLTFLESTKGINSNAKGKNQIFLITKFANHASHNVIIKEAGKSSITYVSGAVSSLKRSLCEFYVNVFCETLGYKPKDLKKIIEHKKNIGTVDYATNTAFH